MSSTQHEKSASLLDIVQLHTAPPAEFLSAADERRLANWTVQLQSSGFRVTPAVLGHSASLLIKNRNQVHRFRSPACQSAWCQAFAKRHPDVELHASTEHIEWKASDWFAMVRGHLAKHNIDGDVLMDGNRVFCLTELAFALQLDDGPGAVVEKKGARRARNADCDEVTVMLGGSAAGTMVPSMALFDRMRLSKCEREFRVPPSWAIAGSETGWMTAATLYEYMVDTFHPWVLERRIALPVAVFVDGFATQVTHVLSEFCDRGQIVLVGLPATEANATQPLDLCVLGPLLSAWRDTLAAAPDRTICPASFCTALSDAVDRHIGRDLFEYAFKVCGIFPFPVFDGSCQVGQATAMSTPIRRKRRRRSTRASGGMQRCSSIPADQTLEPSPPFDDTANSTDLIKCELSEIGSEAESTSDIENRHGQRPQPTENEAAVGDKTEVLQFCLSQLEEQVGGKLASFLSAPDDWNGPDEDGELYKLWRGMKNDLEQCERSQSGRTRSRVLLEPPNYVCKIHF